MVDKTFEKNFLKECEKVVESYANVVASSKLTVNPSQRRKNESSIMNHIIGKSIRLQGIAEDLSKTEDGNLVPTNAEKNEVTKILVWRH